MVGSLFADTIKYTYKGELKVKENVTFKRADDKYIHNTLKALHLWGFFIYRELHSVTVFMLYKNYGIV